MASPSSSSDPFELRITNHGKIRNFVSFALNFIKENPSRPLVLHTLPRRDEENGRNDMSIGDGHLDSNVVEKQTSDNDSEYPVRKRKLHASTSTIPKLITVVEITKREYIKWVRERKKSGGSEAVQPNVLCSGLHQYNQLETLQDLELLPSDKQEQESNLTRVLSGRNYPKQDRTPHLRITLSVSALPALEELHGATHQSPSVVVKSKSARSRERRKQRKAERAAE